MNMAFKPHSVAVRVLDQTDANELARIDAFIAASAQGTVFHRPAWMLSVSKACGHDWRYLLAEDGDGALIGILPLHSGVLGLRRGRRHNFGQRPGCPVAGR